MRRGHGENFTSVVPFTQVREKILEDFAIYFLREAAADSALMVEPEVILVFEDSASMQYNDLDRKRLEIARTIIVGMSEGEDIIVAS